MNSPIADCSSACHSTPTAASKVSTKVLVVGTFQIANPGLDLFDPGVQDVNWYASCLGLGEANFHFARERDELDADDSVRTRAASIRFNATSR
jgi:hypothetical protein